MTKEEIYSQMRGQYTVPTPIPCEFEEGKPCWTLYSRVCDARERISRRTGIGFEDRDMMEIVEGLEEIGRLCALKMYEYGAKFG